jgi:hypothetical protein
MLDHRTGKSSGESDKRSSPALEISLADEVTLSRIGVVYSGKQGDVAPHLESKPAESKQEAPAHPDPIPPDTRDDAAVVKAELLLIQAALAKLTVESDAQISGLRREFEDAVNTDDRKPGVEETKSVRFSSHLTAPVVVTALFALAAALLILHSRGLLSWSVASPFAASAAPVPVPQAAVLPQPPGTLRNPPAAPRSPDSTASQSAEARALNRLDDLLRPIAPAAIPSLLSEANQWLGQTGSPPCSVQSPRGETSMVISPYGQHGLSERGPLVTALSRCADAIEHFTRKSAPNPAGTY